jgi:hypothetical protein
MGKVESVVDTFGVPEYFAPAYRMEDAGDGMIRIVRGIERHGIFIPACSTVMPAITVMRLGKEAIEFARSMLMECSGSH